MERIEILRKIPLERDLFSRRFYYLFYKKYEQLEECTEEERYAESFYHAFAELKPSITEGELIVGKRDLPLLPQEKQEWEEKYNAIHRARSAKAGDGQDSHMAIDYELVLHHGVTGVIDKIDSYLESCKEEQKVFYRACKRCLEAVIVHAHHYAEKALELSENECNPARKEEFLEISRICEKVPAYPADTFYEAVQSVHFITYCLTLNPFRVGDQQFQLGHPDRYLWPYYEADKKAGRITPQKAQLLLDCLGIQINMRVPRGLSSGYMVGGTDAEGNVVANELTRMCMQVIEDIRLVYPAVGFCYTDKMPEEFLEQACHILSGGFSHPAIFNDDVIVKGLRYYGVPEAEAHDYIHSTCVEITPIAASNVWVASPYTNMVQLLLDVMDREYTGFEQLYEAVLAKLDEHIKRNFLVENRFREIRAVNSMNPLLSCFVNDCLKRGVDIERGGAKYNWIMPSFVGMANLVDSLYVVRQLVFEEKELTIARFKEILEKDFRGEEELRLRVLHHIPKYGNDIDEVDQYFTGIVDHIVKECQQYHGMHENGNLIPSVFCWIMHAEFGKDTGATPDGRTAGFPLGDGSGPCQGREMNGPTASVLSSTKWDHEKMIGGVAVNLKFSKALLGQHSMMAMKSLIKTYMARGGFEMQINVTDNEILKKAQERPMEYQDLVVRIGGYSDYFVKLSPGMQAEVIQRTTHSC